MTFVQDGRPNPDTVDLIIDEMIAAAEQSFGEELDGDSALVLRAFYRPIAEYLAMQQQDLAAVLNSAQIDYADGEALDLLTALIGVSRQPATAATSRAVFSRDTPTTRDYSIPSGTEIQTDETNPIVFETDYPTDLPYIDGFEDNDITEYSGDTASFTTVTTPVYDGSYALEGAAANAKIFDANREIERGATYHVRQYLNTGAVAKTLFAVQDTDNYYAAVLDEAAGEIRIESNDDGTVATIGSGTAATLPTGEWLHVEIDWQHRYDFVLTVYDSTGTEMASASVTDSSEMFTSGGIGYASADTTATKYWDEFTTTAVGVDVTATGAGADTNVGATTLTVLRDEPEGIQDVTNPIPATGGEDREEDDDLRARAKEQLSEGMRATVPALITEIQKIDLTRAVTVIENDDDTTDAAGRPPHSFEAIVDVLPDAEEDVAQTIIETRAAGTTSVGGYAGTAVSVDVELSNGQTVTVTYSKPTPIQIYIDCDLQKTDEYGGDDEVQDNIVQYLGGTLNSGDDIGGEIGTADDVVYNQVLEAIMDISGVHDVTNLEIGTSSSPTGTSNITIASNESAYGDATDSSLSITSSDV